MFSDINQFEFYESHKKKTWLITGVAGFIGSSLAEALLRLNQHVVGLDNFYTGHHRNLDDVMRRVSPLQWSNFKLIIGDVCILNDCYQAVNGVDYVLHHAAVSSVAKSIEDPILTNNNNVNGFLNILLASRAKKVKRVVYASSSAVYGNKCDLSNAGEANERPLSPYAVTKRVNELYADVFYKVYGVESIGLRYFNVYGPRQDPKGAYAAVIPTWINCFFRGEPVFIYGDGETCRDFCYIDDVVQANLLAATTKNPVAVNQLYDVGFGESTTLNVLFNCMKQYFVKRYPECARVTPVYQESRVGDVRYSRSCIRKTQLNLDYNSKHSIREGLRATMEWYLDYLGNECTIARDDSVVYT